MTFCPASMCPLFAPDGSPWTGEKNGVCPRSRPLEGLPGSGCGWWGLFDAKGCGGCNAAIEQIAEVEARGYTLQIGPVRMKRGRVKPKKFDCPRASECEWQIEAGEKLCPPRLALARGIDPKACAC